MIIMFVVNFVSIVSLGSLSINDLNDVLKAIWDARAKWESIGLSLGILYADLEVIKQEAGPSIDARFRAMVEFWLTRKEPRPTWAALVDALKSPVVGLIALAHRIQAL